MHCGQLGQVVYAPNVQACLVWQNFESMRISRHTDDYEQSRRKLTARISISLKMDTGDSGTVQCLFCIAVRIGSGREIRVGVVDTKRLQIELVVTCPLSQRQLYCLDNL